jgi:hypothetical protein
MSLSLNQGGWIHPHVMDCFGMLLTTEQIEGKKQTGSNEVLNHVVIKDITVCIVPKPFLYQNYSYCIILITEYPLFSCLLTILFFGVKNRKS